MPMVITDPRRPDNPIVFVNAAFQKLTGYERDEIIGRNCRILQGPDTDPEAVAALRRAIEAGHDIQVDLLNYRKDGTPFWNALYLSPVRGADGEIQFFFASQLDVTDRVQAHDGMMRQKAEVEAEVEARTRELKQALEAKDILLHEVDHRVKNNLTMIGSLLRLQARSLPDPQTRRTLDSMLERVDALATVHRRLYQSSDLAHFAVAPLLETLTADIVGASGRDDIHVVTRLQPVTIAPSYAASLGLIVNEILTNAVKHACNERACTLTVTMTQQDGRATITIADDGPGLPASPVQGLGRTLIQRLSRQIKATTDWTSTPSGAAVVIAFEARP